MVGLNSAGRFDKVRKPNGLEDVEKLMREKIGLKQPLVIKPQDVVRRSD